MRLCIFGFGKFGTILANLLDKAGSNISIAYYCDNNVNLHKQCDSKNRAVVAVNEVPGLLERGAVDGVCIPATYSYQRRIAMINQLRRLGVSPEHIYVAKKELFSDDENDCDPVKAVVRAYDVEKKYAFPGKEKLRAAIYLRNIGDSFGRYLYNVIRDCCENTHVCCFFTDDMNSVGKTIDGIEVVSIYNIMQKYREGEIDSAFFHPLFHMPILERYVGQLRGTLAEKDIFIASHVLFKKETLREGDFASMFISDTRLLHYYFFSVLLVSHCVLKCVNCGVCASLDKQKQSYDLQNYRSDVSKIAGLIGSDPVKIRLMGGEPLLHGQLSDILYITRELFPYSEIEVWTNAVLILKMSDELIKAFRNTKSIFTITLYPPMLDKIDETLMFLRENHIRYEAYPEARTFWTVFNFNPSNDINASYNNCVWKTCPCLADGVLAKCTIPLAIPAFNEYWGKDIPVCDDDIINVRDESITGEDILNKISRPGNTCKYCNWAKPTNNNWRQMDETVTIDDWVAK